jgi:hypothetical protein
MLNIMNADGMLVILNTIGRSDPCQMHYYEERTNAVQVLANTYEDS